MTCAYLIFLVGLFIAATGKNSHVEYWLILKPHYL